MADSPPYATPDSSFDDYDLRYLPLLKAATKGDWATAKGIIDNDINAATTKITTSRETALHIAVGANVSRYFVKKLVERIVDRDRTRLRYMIDSDGSTALHIAAAVGNTEAAKILMRADPDLRLVRKNLESVPTGTPLNVAAFYAQKNTLLYLLEGTEGSEEHATTTRHQFEGVYGGSLITRCIFAGFYDVAFRLVVDYPDLASKSDGKGCTALQALAKKPQAFASGTQGWFWKNVKYSRHQLTRELSKLICSEITKHNDHNTIRKILVESMTTATEYGVNEIVEDCLEAYPSVLWYSTGEIKPWLLNAIQNRQANVYNIIHQLAGHKIWVTSAVIFNEGNNALHMVAKLAPSHRLNTVTGAALQMQRELQWFKEVEARVEPSFREALNLATKTPRMLFTDEHAELVKKGEKWMKTTASSSTVVAALIITMAFAAAFTVPGGNKDQGAPIFLKQIRFRFFIISDAVALFSASTSVLMFLSILTSRYAEEDFLKSLPIKLTIGLLFLFISIAATMIAFGATLALVIHRKGFWIPIAALACIPIMVFALLQSPLLVELVISTYGRSIFRKQSNIILH